MKKLNKLLIVAGTGRNSGKTSLACSIIKQFIDIKPIALKISPHFHKPSEGLEVLFQHRDYNIYREWSEKGHKDSSKMLISGASEAYYIQVYDNNAGEAFNWLLKNINADQPIVCESPALGRYIQPGGLIIADSESIANKKDLGELYSQADRVFMLGDKPDDLVIDYIDKRWVIE